MSPLSRSISTTFSPPASSANVYESLPRPIYLSQTSSHSKWDNIKRLEEEERQRDLQTLREPRESHLVELIVALSVVALVIIIIVKCFCENRAPLSNWFNSKYRPGSTQSRRTSLAAQAIQNVGTGGGEDGDDGTELTKVPGDKHIIVRITKLQGNSSSTATSPPSSKPGGDKSKQATKKDKCEGKVYLADDISYGGNTTTTEA